MSANNVWSGPEISNLIHNGTFIAWFLTTSQGSNPTTPSLNAKHYVKWLSPQNMKIDRFYRRNKDDL